MKIAFAVNHTIMSSDGGCERVVKQISEGLLKFGHQCFVFSPSYQESSRNCNGVIYDGTGSSIYTFLKRIEDCSVDHLFIYSDMFKFWEGIVENAGKIKCKKTIALVGMNNSLNNGRIFCKFLKNKDKFNIVVHSDKYIDYLVCVHNKIKTTVIPNGVDISEFNGEQGEFRKKYSIKEKNIALCVSNFFPGKGQEFLIPIFKNIKDCVLVLICSPDFSFCKILQNNFFINAKNSGINFKLLSGIPRCDTIDAFIDADVFVFPSQKEVAPLVILESMASKTPWVSMPVGNTREFQGGIIVENDKKDVDGNFVYDDRAVGDFRKAINNILLNIETKKKMSEDGLKLIEEKFSIDKIIKKYNDFFTNL